MLGASPSGQEVMSWMHRGNDARPVSGTACTLAGRSIFGGFSSYPRQDSTDGGSNSRWGLRVSLPEVLVGIDEAANVGVVYLAVSRMNCSVFLCERLFWMTSVLSSSVDGRHCVDHGFAGGSEVMYLIKSKAHEGLFNTLMKLDGLWGVIMKHASTFLSQVELTLVDTDQLTGLHAARTDRHANHIFGLTGGGQGEIKVFKLFYQDVNTVYVGDKDQNVGVNNGPEVELWAIFG
eukprot:1160560-Pelagomonas_calceolata.AAC.1